MRKLKLRFQNKSKADIGSQFSFNTDERLLEVCEQQFLRQQNQFHDLHDHLQSFIKGIISFTETIDNMYTCFRSIYETNWVGNLEFNHMCQETIKVRKKFAADFKFNISKSLEEYGQEFPYVTRIIDKRNKKIAELRKQRRVYENFRNAKKIDEIKLKKAEMEMKNIERDYQDQSDTLKELLPNFCDRRIDVYINLWRGMFEAEQAMFSFLQQGRSNHLTVLSKLSNAADTGQYKMTSQASAGKDIASNLLSTKTYSKSATSLFGPNLQYSEFSHFEADRVLDVKFANNLPPSTAPVVQDSSTFYPPNNYQDNSTHSSKSSEVRKTSMPVIPMERVSIGKPVSSTHSSKVAAPSAEEYSLFNDGESVRSFRSMVDSINTSDIDTHANDLCFYASIQKGDRRQLENRSESFSSDNYDSFRKSAVYDTIDESESYYQVRATFDYYSQDNDELDLRKNDLILVLPWDCEEQMEDGWLFGENSTTKKRGIFPENHTRALDG